MKKKMKNEWKLWYNIGSDPNDRIKRGGYHYICKLKYNSCDENPILRDDSLAVGLIQWP